MGINAEWAGLNADSNFELFKQGAEARLFTGTFLGVPVIAKERFPKKYRHPSLDLSITKERLRNEARGILRCKAAGIRTPTVYYVDINERVIYLEHIPGPTAKDYINNQIEKGDEESLKNLKMLSEEIGRVLGRMHQGNIIHGDLTTSNIIVVDGSPKDVCLIDFGLSQMTQSAEDKGVDLYVLDRAILSTHKDSEKIFCDIMTAYKEANKKGCKEVMSKFEEVRARGRKRSMVG